MLMFSTRLPVKAEITEQQCLNLFIEWVKKSPHYDASEIGIDANNHDDCEYKNDKITVTFRSFHDKDKSIHLSACRLRYRDSESDALWDTDYIFSAVHEKKSILIQLNYTKTNYEKKLPRCHKPYIVKMLIKNNFCDWDGLLPITDTPIPADEDNYELYRDIMCGTLLDYEMPVVYVSKNYQEATEISPIKLAQELGGIAHVFVEKNYDIARKLLEDTKRNNVHHGYVGIYFPKTQKCQRYGLQNYNNDERKMYPAIIEDVWNILRYRSDSTEYNWNQVDSLRARQKMLEIEGMSEQQKKEKEEYIETFDRENKELKDKIEALYQEKISLQSERDRLREAKNMDGLFYHVGEEKELYDGELNDLLYSILSQAKDKYAEDSRGRVLIESLLKANPKKGACEKLIAGIKDVFKDGEVITKAKKKRLEQLGFSVKKDGRHDKLIFNGDNRYMFPVSKTPSDQRGPKNLCSTICKIFNVEKKV